ncbi:MAG: conjugal transfer protein TraX [Clostridiales bacterium]|nr:conjugal transfer protein TraX [Clostridiales bacterium]
MESGSVETKKRGTISGSTLKIIAMVAMLIDHTAATILDKVLLSMGAGNIGQLSPSGLQDFYSQDGVMIISIIDGIMRLIGRLGFPIFCFLLIEGVVHTKNIYKYIIRLGMFALISEIPFDLAFNGSLLEFTYQNVFFTLLISVMMLAIWEGLDEKMKNKTGAIILKVVVLAVAMAAAYFLKTDYNMYGVLTVAVMYVFRKKKVISVMTGCIVLTIMSLFEATAFFVLIPVSKYNGTRGLNLKYVFYAFYPVHLLILYGICVLMGIA